MTINTKNLVLFIFLLISFTTIKSQTIEQLGYYSINGISAISSKTNIMVLGNGNIINISNPSLPILIGNISIGGFSTSVLVSENNAYFGTGMNVNLIIADITNPALPVQKSIINFPASTGGIFGLSKNNNNLFLAMGGDGICCVNVTNNTNPLILDTLYIPNGQARDIVTQGSHAYIAHYDGLKILDISDPSKMEIISSIGSGYNSIDINNNLVYLGKNAGGIDVFNISDPNTPILEFSIPNSNGWAWDIKYYNNLIYSTTDYSGLFIYKVDNNTGIEMAHFANTGNGQSFAVSLQDSLILLSGLINGIAILKYDSLGTVGIKTERQMDQINIFPNPAKDYIEFNQNDDNITEIEIINIYGDCVMKEYCINTINRIDISNILRGSYIVSFKSNKKVWQGKFIKID